MRYLLTLGVLAFFLFTMAQEKIECTLLVDSGSHVGEGAIWDYKSERLLWIDIKKMQIHIYYPNDSTKNITVQAKLKVGTVVPKSKDTCIVALHDGIYSLCLSNETFTKQSDLFIDTVLNRFNDGKCDPNSRLWVGTMHVSAQKPTGSLYSFTNSFSYTKHLENITVSNGIAWSADGTKMYYIDTPTQKVVQYDFNKEEGRISNPNDIIIIPKALGSPDGSTIDADGNLWIAMWNGGCVTCWDTKTGKMLRKIEVPAWNVTSVAFGGENLDELYITTAKLWMPEGYVEKYPHAGGLFVCKPGVKGVKAQYFK